MSEKSPPTGPSALPYIVPFVLFLVCTAAEGSAAFESNYPGVYSAKVLVVCAALVGCRKAFLQFPFRLHAGAILIGLAGTAMWVAVEKFVPYPKLESATRAAFNPFAEIASPTGQWAFLAVRMFGLAVMVPILEEVFWRGFLLRWVVNADFRSVPIGRYTPASFVAVSVLFASAHPEWLPALLYSAGLNLLLYRTRDLWACVQVHAATNLALGAYVIWVEDWVFW